jgi:SAM-dependent methyltransferase
MPSSAAAYDRIAHLYDEDMGGNMPFDDVAWYLERVAAAPGRVLEAGCGTGRVLLPLLARGRDALGIDASPRMIARLQDKARAAGISPRVLVMEAPVLGLAGGAFGAVLAPYSMVTYLDQPEALVAFLREAHRVTRPGGLLIVDAFLPREIGSYDEYRLDYGRVVGGRAFERWKRIRALPDGRNRVDRRYRVAGDTPFETSVTIRPYSPDDLIAAAGVAGWRAVETALDYGRAAVAAAARFATVVFARPDAAPHGQRA